MKLARIGFSKNSFFLNSQRYLDSLPCVQEHWQHMFDLTASMESEMADLYGQTAQKLAEVCAEEVPVER